MRILVTLALLISSPLSAAELIMVEEHGCFWCARWDKEISEIYPKTEEGKTAPLRRLDINAAKADTTIFATPVHFTPTFVLIDKGKEIGRIEGYPGEDFFWGLLKSMIDKLPVKTVNNQ